MDEEEKEVSDGVLSGYSHTHYCNPHGPEDASHSHTCFHTNTHLIIPDSQENDHSDSSNKKRSCGNREAVRRYREKKKARTAYLEDEVKILQSLNDHLLRKLQSQAIVETEFNRLRTLLVEMQGMINGGYDVATENVMCEAARVECEESQALDATHSFVPHSPPFSH